MLYRNFHPHLADNIYMKTLSRHFAAFLLVLFLSCSVTQCSVFDKITGGTEVGSPSVNDDPSDDVAAGSVDPASEPTNNFTTLAEGSDGDLSVTARNQIYESQDELQSAWELLFPGETAPTVDFTEFHVAFVVMGEQATGGNAIEISSIEMNDIDFDMLVTVTTAGSGCAVTQAFTNPYHIVQIDASSESLRRHFVTEVFEESCE